MYTRASTIPAVSPTSELSSRLETSQVSAGIIGLGYVGLPLAHTMHASGLRVIGFDVDPAKISALAAGRNYLRHLGDEMTRTLARSQRFDATTDLARLSEPDAIVVCVPTPLGEHHEPDLGYVLSAAEAIGRVVRPGQLLVLESTTYPGTTRDVFLPAVLASAAARPGIKLVPGKNLFVAFSPEREDPGRKSHTTRTIPKLVGGLDDKSTRLATSLYRRFIEEVQPVASAEVAEAAKLLENIFRSVNIALVNEMKVILDAMGLDVWDVIDAAASKPFGFMPFYPGPGLGGHCIPIDPFYLSWKAKEVGKPTRFIELAGEINTEMPAYVVSRVALALNSVGKPIRGASILVLGLAYKADVDDMRESPAFELIERLSAMGARVDYSDPHIPRTPRVRKHDLQLTSVELTPESLASYDVALLCTAHGAFDYDMIADHARLVVDTRNAFRQHAPRMHGRLFRA